MPRDIVSTLTYTSISGETNKQTFDIRYANEPAHDYFGEGKELAEKCVHPPLPHNHSIVIPR